MAKPHHLRLLMSATAVAALILATAAAGDDFSWVSTENPPATCQGSIGECMIDGEFEMDTETNRRILASRRRYISYGAMRPGQIPCSRRGSSYYSNCRRNGAVNPYRRSCSKITKCRS
ncbi:Protein RALF-like 33 [Striga hermonthica]|uniref:Protein RALF-like 33 n=1 Tax=Striga hermonthica TaxID=68872 RepID=A0A9N7RFW5_STRHE|nr:Protein RALF-like 33 [Striga hermonthica]